MMWSFRDGGRSTTLSRRPRADKQDALGWLERNSKESLVEILTTMQRVPRAMHGYILDSVLQLGQKTKRYVKCYMLSNMNF
jgi:hypothetical protein